MQNYKQYQISKNARIHLNLLSIYKGILIVISLIETQFIHTPPNEFSTISKDYEFELRFLNY